MAAMDRRLRRLEVDTVIVDNVQGAYEAVSHLVRLGHRRIGLIGGPVHTYHDRARAAGRVQEGFD
jgi:LacI family transcriptional regulator